MAGVVVNGTDLYKKAQSLLENPNPKNPWVDYEKAFHWFNILLNGAYEANDPSLAALYFAVGAVSMKREHKMLALLCYQKAVEIDPKFLEAINNIAYLHKKLDHDEEAKYYFKHVLDLALEMAEKDTNPEFVKTLAEYYANYGSMFVGRGIPDVALEYFKEGEKYNPDCRMIKYNRSLAYLEKGEYAKGFPEFDYGDRIDRCEKRHYGKDNLPWWDGTPGKKLVVIGEQGIGDEIMFATLLPKLMKDCGVVLDAHPRLTTLFQRTFPNIDIYGTRKDESDTWGNRYDFDAKVMLGSLPRFYCKSKDDFLPNPYLKADPLLVEKYRAKLETMGDRPKIGISWRGGSKVTDLNNYRYIPLTKWLSILRLPCDFISLQYDKDIEQGVKEFEDKHQVSINHWPDVLADYDETAGLVSCLDLVISVPQSVVHLAGALGTYTMQLTPKQAMWQMGCYGEKMPWYDTVASIWQKENGDWDGVLKEVENHLCSLLQTNTES